MASRAALHVPLKFMLRHLVQRSGVWPQLNNEVFSVCCPDQYSGNISHVDNEDHHVSFHHTLSSHPSSNVNRGVPGSWQMLEINIINNEAISTNAETGILQKTEY